MTTSPIACFFDSFATQSDSDNIKAQASQFADTFLAAGPQGAKCVSSADFSLALSKRKQTFARLGCQSTKLASLEEIPLDKRYVLAKTRWEMTFKRSDADATQVLVDSTFIVDTAPGEPKIILYLAHQDIFEALRSRGISAL